MLLHRIRLIGSLMLLASAGVWAQVPVSVPASDPLAPPAPESAVTQTLVPIQSGADVAPVALQTAAPSLQYDLPAGVCPVITDYLYQQCQQNPADAMCAPPVAATD